MSADTLLWLAPTLGAMFAWGIAQGLVKKYIGDVPPARFCLYYAFANAFVSLAFWYFSPGDAKPEILDPEHRQFLYYGIGAYLLDGIAWIFYYQSIVAGPISIVGTLSAAYPALTIIFARLFLEEQLSYAQYGGVVCVILGCLGLAYSPDDGQQKKTHARWIPFAGIALLIWGVNGTLIKYAYSLPGANEANMAMFIAVGGLCTLGVYGLIFGRQGAMSRGQWAQSLLPMATMALGGLLAAISYKKGPASIVTPIAGAYPVVTLAFAAIVLKERPTRLHWACIVSILVGMVLTTLS